MKPTKILTGSSVYGPYNFDSDIDIVVDTETARVINDQVSRLGLFEYVIGTEEYEDSVRSFYFNIGQLKFNIIVVKDEETADSWAKAVEVMKTIPPINDKEERINLFRGIRES